MKFSIRDLLLVTVIVALAVGWWIDHRAASRLAAELARLRERETILESKREVLLRALEAMTDKTTTTLVDSGSPVMLYPAEFYSLPMGTPSEPRRTLSNSSAPAPKLPKE